MTPDDIDTKIRSGLEVMTEPGQVFEIRSWKGDRISSGYFDDIDAAAAAIAPLDAAGADGPDGIYLTLNPVNPDLLARRANRMKVSTKKDASTSDADIIRRRWLPIDIDAKRASGISSTDQEHAAALERALSIAADLAERGWPEPIRADSANGAHLVYRIDLPNDEKSTALIKAVLAALDAIYSDGAAEVDTGNFNASRIWKVYGTVSRKGDNTPTRPHRRARLLDAPETLEAVTREQLAAVAIMVPAADPTPRPKVGTTRAPGEALDLAAWLRDNGIGVDSEKPYQGGTLYKLDGCPFGGGHKDGAFCIQFPSGAIHAGCHHNSCGSGSQRWPELRERFDGPRPPASSTTAKAPKAAAAPAAAGPPPDETPTDPAIDREAREVLERGDPFAYAVAAYNLEHVGDTVLGQCCALSYASRVVKNSKGIHIMTTGESGKGKSDAFSTFSQQLPARFKLDGALSDKVLYYKGEDGSLLPGTVVTIDDKDLSETLQELLKEATSDFRKPINLHTLDSNKRPKSIQVPPRCVLWLAKVEGAGDDQILNRMLNLWVDDSEDQDRAVLARLVEEAARDDDEDASEERREIAIARRMWEILDADGLIDVNLSRFVRRIRFGSVRNRRNPRMFHDMIRSVARTRAAQRQRRTLPNGTVRIYATEADFTTAAAVFTALHGTAGGQETHLTRLEEDLVGLISKAGLREFTIPMLQKLTKFSDRKIGRALKGEKPTGSSKLSGLLDKVPFIAEIDMSESESRKVYDPTATGEEARKTVTTGRRATIYTFDQGVYQSWRNKTAVWLEGETPGNGPDSESDKTAKSAGFRGISAGLSAETNTANSPVSSESREREESLIERNGVSAEIQGSERDNSGAIDHEGTIDRAHDPAENRGNSRGKIEPAEIARMAERAADTAPSFRAEMRGNARKCAESAETLKSQTEPAPPVISKVDPADYTRIIEKVAVEPCARCGARLVHYQERGPVMKARKGKLAYRICAECYEAAKRHETAAIQILPGTLPIDEVEPVDHPEHFGRCTVCDVGKVAYRHPGSNSAICSGCYEKVAREQVDIR